MKRTPAVNLKIACCLVAAAYLLSRAAVAATLCGRPPAREDTPR